MILCMFTDLTERYMLSIILVSLENHENISLTIVGDMSNGKYLGRIS